MYKDKPWLLKFHNILFDIFDEKYNLHDLDCDDEMCVAVAFTLGRLDCISDKSENDIVAGYLSDHLKDIEDAKSGFSDLIAIWQANNWRALNV